MQPVSNLPFFFIMGRPRSGTTLLRTLLDAHPEVKVPPEYPVLLDLYKQFGAKPIKNEHAKTRFLEAFKQPLLFDFWKYVYLNIQENELVNDLKTLSSEARFEEIIKLFYYHSGSFFPKQDIKLLGDKNPVYALYTHRLMKIFPEAKIIFIHRDYRDNFVSMRKFEFEAPNIILQAYRWNYIAQMMLNLRESHPEKVLFVKYEDLASFPEQAFKKVCNFLEIEFNASVFEFYKQKKQSFDLVGKDTFLKYHESLTHPVSPKNIDLWKSQLTAKEVRIADAICNRNGRLLNYSNGGQALKAGEYIPVAILKSYGFILYKLMLAGEYLPYKAKTILAKTLPLLAKTYRKVMG